MKNSLLVFAICSFFIAHTQTKLVLFIGNSYTAVNDLPNLVYNIALANGDTIYYEANAPGGSYFNAHKTNPTTLAKIASRDWDYVVLQEQSQLPALPLEIAGVDYSPPSATDLCDLIRENDSCTDIVFYMTWGRKEGDVTFCADVPEMCTYEGMQLLLREAYIGFAEDNEAAVAPAGMGWKSVIDDDPTIELYSGDGSHPNINGSYLTACIFYATLFQESPIGNTFHAGITDELALYLQTKAHEIVFDSLEIWRIGEGDLVPEFDFSKVFFTYTFENVGSGTVLNWTIDGDLYSEENPVHVFPEDGYYDVTLTVFDACDTVSITETILVGVDDAGIIQDNLNSFLLYPNPVNEQLYIRLNSEETVQIYDVLGRKLIHLSAITNTEIDMANWPTGTYLVQIGTEFSKIIKQ